VLRLVFLDRIITMLQHQPLLVAEMPDRTVDQLCQYRRQILRRLLVDHGMIEDIENIHQLAVIFVDFVEPDAQYLVPNNIFHVSSLPEMTDPECGVDEMTALAAETRIEGWNPAGAG